MISFLPSSLLALALLLNISTSVAGARIDLSVEQAERSNDYAVFVDTHKIRVLDQTAKAVGLIFDSASGQMILLDHRRKTYLRLTQKRVNEISSVVESIGQIARQQGGVLGDLISTFGLDSALGEVDTIEVTHSGSSERIAGLTCKHLQVWRNKQAETQLCIAPKLSVNAVDTETLRSLLRFSQQLSNKAGHLLSALGLALPVLPAESFEGFPLSAIAEDGALNARVSKISNEAVDATLFVIPKGYVETDLPI